MSQLNMVKWNPQFEGSEKKVTADVAGSTQAIAAGSTQDRAAGSAQGSGEPKLYRPSAKQYQAMVDENEALLQALADEKTAHMMSRLKLKGASMRVSAPWRAQNEALRKALADEKKAHMLSRLKLKGAQERVRHDAQATQTKAVAQTEMPLALAAVDASLTDISLMLYPPPPPPPPHPLHFTPQPRQGPHRKGPGQQPAQATTLTGGAPRAKLRRGGLERRVWLIGREGLRRL